MPGGKVSEILRSETYLDVRRNKPAPCFDTGRGADKSAKGSVRSLQDYHADIH